MATRINDGSWKSGRMTQKRKKSNYIRENTSDSLQELPN